MFPKLRLQVCRGGVRHLHQTKCLLLNRIFVEKSELCVDSNLQQVISLQSTDERFQHLENILKLKIGDRVKMGVVDAGITDSATIQDKTGSEMTINMGKVKDLRATPKPPIDLILAFPRPARLTWLFPVISSLGVGRISLIRAAKTEKGYMASHYYTSMNDKLRKLLMLGLSQASVDCWMPQCELHPSHDIQEFFHQLDDKYPPQQYLRLLAHPLKLGSQPGATAEGVGVQEQGPVTYRRQLNNNLDLDIVSPTSSSHSVPFHLLQPPATWSLSPVRVPSEDGSGGERASVVPRHDKKIVLAVGPEGGWTEGEVSEFLGRGFVQVHMLGDRVLRTDIAVPALLALAYEWYSAHISSKSKEDEKRCSSSTDHLS